MDIEITPLTQETADQFAEAFSRIQEETESNIEYVVRIRENIERLAIEAVATRHAYYTRRLITANFFTRWYWRRKVVESEKNMRELAQIIKENNE